MNNTNKKWQHKAMMPCASHIKSSLCFLIFDSLHYSSSVQATSFNLQKYTYTSMKTSNTFLALLAFGSPTFGFNINNPFGNHSGTSVDDISITSHTTETETLISIPILTPPPTGLSGTTVTVTGNLQSPSPAVDLRMRQCDGNNMSFCVDQGNCCPGGSYCTAVPNGASGCCSNGQVCPGPFNPTAERSGAGRTLRPAQASTVLAHFLELGRSSSLRDTDGNGAEGRPSDKGTLPLLEAADACGLGETTCYFYAAGSCCQINYYCTFDTHFTPGRCPHGATCTGLAQPRPSVIGLPPQSFGGQNLASSARPPQVFVVLARLTRIAVATSTGGKEADDITLGPRPTTSAALIPATILSGATDPRGKRFVGPNAAQIEAQNETTSSSTMLRPLRLFSIPSSLFARLRPTFRGGRRL